MAVKVHEVCSVTFQTDLASHDQYSCLHPVDTVDKNCVDQECTLKMLPYDLQIVTN